MPISCFVCKAVNPDHARFCGQCGAALSPDSTWLYVRCPACGFMNSARFRFCGQCGAALDAERSTAAAGVPAVAPPMPSFLAAKVAHVGPRIEGERREVVILFADVSDFTPLASRLDPEEVYHLVNRCLELLVAEVYRYEGIVDKFTGDGLMALFGAPLAHEDDAERAVLAALGMQEALRALNAELRSQRRPAIGLRIGLHAGPVVAGRVGSDLRMEYTVIGDTVNLAARLQKAAAPGTVLVSQAVYQPTALLFHYRALPPFSLKGFSEEIIAYEALGVRSQRGRVRGIPGLQAPLIGRDEEIAQLEAAAERLVREGRGQVIMISGEAGIGKSRLLAEFWERAGRHNIRILQGNCLAHTSSINYFPFAEILRNHLGGTAGRASDLSWQQLCHQLESLAPDLPEEDRAPLASLMGVPLPDAERERLSLLNPAQLQSRTFLAVRDLLVAEAKQQPLILALDDLHWADELTLDLLTFLVDAVQDAPFMLVATSRPMHGEPTVKLGPAARAKAPDRYLHLRLEELSATDTEALLHALVAAPDLPEEFRQAILARAEGNPFYLEEILRMLIDQGVLYRDNGTGWRLKPEADLAALAVPPTLQGLVMARFDRLTEDLRLILQTASVIGYRVPERLLAAVLDANSPPETWQPQLRELVALDFLRVQRESPEREYVFRHTVTQEAVYRSLLNRRREALHQQVAEAIERLYADQLEERLDELAHHYYLSPARQKALHYILLAAQRAAKNFANARARQLYEQAEPLLLSLPDVPPAQQVAAFSGLADVLMFLGDYEAARDRYRTALRWLTTANETWPPEDAASLQRKISHTYVLEEDYDEALAWLAAAVESLNEAETPSARVERARIYSDWGWVYLQRGEWDAAEEWLQAALNLLRDTSQYEELASIYNRRSWLSFKRGEWAIAASYAQQSLALREKLGDTQGMAGSYASLGMLMELQGYWHEAIAYHLQAMEMHQRTGDTRGVALAHLSLGVIHTHQGNFARAQEHLDKGLELAQRLNSLPLLVQAYRNLANLGIWRREWKEALMYLKRASSLAETGRLTKDLADLFLLEGEVWLELGEAQKASERAQRALAAADEAGPNGEARGRAWWLLGVASLRQGDPQAARAHLGEALQWFLAHDNRFELGRTYLEMARAEQAEGNLVAASDNLLRAWDIFRALDARPAMRLVDAELKALSHNARNHLSPSSASTAVRP